MPTHDNPEYNNDSMSVSDESRSPSPDSPLLQVPQAMFNYDSPVVVRRTPESPPPLRRNSTSNQVANSRASTLTARMLADLEIPNLTDSSEESRSPSPDSPLLKVPQEMFNYNSPVVVRKTPESPSPLRHNPASCNSTSHQVAKSRAKALTARMFASLYQINSSQRRNLHDNDEGLQDPPQLQRFTQIYSFQTMPNLPDNGIQDTIDRINAERRIQRKRTAEQATQTDTIAEPNQEQPAKKPMHAPNQ